MINSDFSNNNCFFHLFINDFLGKFFYNSPAPIIELSPIVIPELLLNYFL